MKSTSSAVIDRRYSGACAPTRCAETKEKPMKLISRLSLGLVLLLTFGMLAVAGPCENIMSMKFPDAKVTLAQNVAAGEFVPPGANARGAAAFKDLPEFCRVAMTLMPSSDSDIRVEIWLPGSGWNG